MIHTPKTGQAQQIHTAHARKYAEHIEGMVNHKKP